MINPAEQNAQEVVWIKRAQHGDHEAFGFLVERFQRRVLARVFRLVGHRDAAEDLAQEVFIKAFRALNSYSFASPFGSWLSRVTVNHCYDFLRRQRAVGIREEPLVQTVGGVETPREFPSTREPDPERRAVMGDLVEKLLARAPAEDRTVMVLKEMEGLSVEEIGRVLGMRTATVKVRLHRARKRMLEDFRRLQQRS
jgi:RNA polymerase sigma-70 factor (ECF subfamily)